MDNQVYWDRVYDVLMGIRTASSMRIARNIFEYRMKRYRSRLLTSIMRIEWGRREIIVSTRDNVIVTVEGENTREVLKAAYSISRRLTMELAPHLYTDKFSYKRLNASDYLKGTGTK